MPQADKLVANGIIYQLLRCTALSVRRQQPFTSMRLQRERAPLQENGERLHARFRNANSDPFLEGCTPAFRDSSA